MAHPNDPERLASMASRLNFLFETVREAHRGRYSYREVAEAITRDQGVKIGASYLHAICTGKQDNPGVQQVEAIAKFFGVRKSFLFGDGDVDGVAEQLEHLRTAVEAKERLQDIDDALSDPVVRIVALKARGLSADHLSLVASVLDQVRQIEGLPLAGDEPAAHDQ